MSLLARVKDLFLPTIDTSAERLLEHLRGIGLDAEMIPGGSGEYIGVEDFRRHAQPTHFWLIGLKKVNIDAIHLPVA